MKLHQCNQLEKKTENASMLRFLDPQKGTPNHWKRTHNPGVWPADMLKGFLVNPVLDYGDGFSCVSKVSYTT